MSVSRELVWLLNQLRNTPQPRERLRLLALGWRSLKGLGPTDRLRVARELGIDGAERLVEELSRRGGMSPSKLLGLLRDAESADPGRLRAMVTGLMDPDGRTEMVQRLADQAVDLLSDDGAIDSDEVTDAVREMLSPDAAAGKPAGDVLPPLPAGGLETPPGIPPGAGPTLAAALAAASRDAKEAGRAFRVEHDAADSRVEPGIERPVIEDRGVGDVVESPPEVAGVVEPEPVTPPAEAAAEPEPVRRTAQRTIEENAPATRRDPGEASAAPGFARESVGRNIEDVLAVLTTEASLIRRLRALRESADELPDVDVFEMRRLMESFPPGWARRRAFETVLRAGLPRDLRTAVATIEELEDPGLRLWALTALADARTLDDRDKEHLLMAADSKLVERRLRSRLR